MRKTLLLALSLTLSGLGGASLATSEGRAFPVREGTVVGEVLSTDIVAFVNGHPIPSMNVNGYTAVAVEDLRRYGFDVGSVPGERRLVIYHRPDKGVSPLPVAPFAGEIGSPIEQVTLAGVSTVYGKEEVYSFGIGGRVAIRLNDLAPYGQVVWKEKERTISFKPDPTLAEGLPPVEKEPLMVRETQVLEIKGISVGEGSVTYKGAEIGYFEDGHPILDVNALGRHLGYATIADEAGMYTVNNGGFSFKVKAGEGIARLYWLGAPVGEVELLLAPVWFDDKLHMRETDLARLFGYESHWNPEAKVLDIRYVDYEVTDFGLPVQWNRYGFRLGASMYTKGVGEQLPMLRLTRFHGEAPPEGGSASLEFVEEQSFYGLSEYSLSSEVPTDLGTNEIGVRVAVGERLLFVKTLVYELDLESVDPIVLLPDSVIDGVGRIRLTAPTDSYTLTGDTKLVIQGEADKAHGSGLKLKVEKKDTGTGSYRKVSEGQLSVGNSGGFAGEAELGAGEGLYRISLYSELSNPRGSREVLVARLYARYTPR